MTLSDWETWACANEVFKSQGEAALFVADQIVALELAGDEDGIKTWQTIAHRIAELGGNQLPPSRQ